MTKEGRRCFSRIWHSVTPDNLEDFDILRDAKPERVSKEALARGKVKKKIPMIHGKTVFTRRARVKVPLL